jgi:hypothetical protein
VGLHRFSCLNKCDSFQVRFTVLIESSASSDKTWDVALWHNFENYDEWTSLSLQSISEPSVVRASSLMATCTI